MSVVLAALLSTACVASFQEPKAPRGESRSEMVSYYLLGAVGRPEVDVRDHCPSGRASEVETHADIVTVGLSLLTIGIYTPRRVTVICVPETKP